MNQPLTVASRASGNQSVNALIEPIRHAETPSPISARPSASAPKLSAMPNTTAPAAVTHRSPATTRRGPKRSSSTPSGSWNSPKVTKYALVSSPRSAAPSANSRARSFAMTALTLRKKYERK